MRVDAKKISGSILTEILSGISRARAVFADITALDELNKRPIRNANVMYEVGLAHACRLAEEVLLFRSDEEELLFDIANVRVNRYAPDTQPEEARQMVAESIITVLQELELRRHLTVRRAVDSLDFGAWLRLLLIANGKRGHPQMRTMRDVMSNSQAVAAIGRLLELGAIRTDYFRITPQNAASSVDEPLERMVEYKVTEFGTAMLRELGERNGLGSPELTPVLEALVQAEASSPSDDHEEPKREG